MKSSLEKIDIEIYSTLNEGKYMTSISKNVYIDKLDHTVDKYSNTYHIIESLK